MAESFTAYFAGVAFAAGKNMAAILNEDATELLKIRRAGLLNAQTAAVTGQLCQPEAQVLRGTATLSGHTPITPTKHDSNNTDPAAAQIGHAGTPGGTAATLRRIFWSSDEPAISAATLDELETLVPMNIIFDAGYGDSNVQPLTLREDQMFMIYNNTGAAGLLDTWIEFTRE